MKELASSEEECNQYINTRQDLAYVSVYRLPTTSLSEDCKLKAEALNELEKNDIEEDIDGDRLMEPTEQRKTLH
jgi:cellulose synthase/poly-beta-1,6-N-acetylglucosamine synthase-like glycosyltransferase